MRRTSLYVLTALVAAGVGYALFQYVIGPRLGDKPVAAVNDAPVQPPAAAPPGDAAGDASSAAMAENLPDVSMPDREGQVRSITSWTGKSMIVNFWATWCAPCRREIPLLNEIQKQQAAKGFQVLGVAVDARDEVLEYAEANTIGYPVLIGEESGIEAASKLGQGSLGLPFTAFTDQQHRIVVTHSGELTKPQADALLEVVGRLNRGELTLQAARALAEERLQALKG
jgi:thiol-disulfide isomerase/thioredoxin